MHLTQAQRWRAAGVAQPARGGRASPASARGAGAAALEQQLARAGAGAAALDLHLATAEITRLLGVGGREQAPPSVAALRAADGPQSHGADGFHLIETYPSIGRANTTPYVSARTHRAKFSREQTMPGVGLEPTMPHGQPFLTGPTLPVCLPGRGGRSYGPVRVERGRMSFVRSAVEVARGAAALQRSACRTGSIARRPGDPYERTVRGWLRQPGLPAWRPCAIAVDRARATRIVGVRLPSRPLSRRRPHRRARRARFRLTIKLDAAVSRHRRSRGRGAIAAVLPGNAVAVRGAPTAPLRRGVRLVRAGCRSCCRSTGRVASTCGRSAWRPWQQRDHGRASHDSSCVGVAHVMRYSVRLPLRRHQGDPAANTSDQLGIRWTSARMRRTSPIARQADVARNSTRFVGPKR